MSVNALVRCWGPDFPSTDPFLRLLALALADGAGSGSGEPGEGITRTPSLLTYIARKVGASADQVHAGLDDLVAIGVLVDRGNDWTWNLW